MEKSRITSCVKPEKNGNAGRIQVFSQTQIVLRKPHLKVCMCVIQAGSSSSIRELGCGNL